MGIDESRHDDARAGVDDLGIGGVDRGRHVANPAVLDQHIAPAQIGDIRVHRDDGARLDQDAPHAA